MLLKLDMASRVPIYMQIRDQVVLGIASGELAPGEKLPTARRIAGTGMSSLLEGRFTVEGYENVRISLDPREAPFIAIEYDGASRIFNLATPEQTTALYDEILEAAA